MNEFDNENVKHHSRFNRRGCEQVTEVKIVRKGERADHTEFQDTVAINKYQWAATLNLIDARVHEIEQKVGWRVRPQLKLERDALVELLCTIDI